MTRSGLLLAYYVVKDDPELLVPLSFVPEFCDDRCTLPCLAQILICKIFFRKTTLRLRVQCSNKTCAQLC